MSEGELIEINRDELAEAERYEVPYAQWRAMSARARGGAKGRWGNKRRQEAKRLGLDPDKYVEMSDAEQAEAREKALLQVASRNEAPEDDDIIDEAPPEETDPLLRPTVSLGAVRLPAEDFKGWKAPENLQDVYSIWPVGDGQHRIRVERIEPKVHQNTRCSGFLGWLTDAIGEEEFGARYGGSIYEVIVYGPDPKGHRNPNTGIPVEKALTDAIRITVPAREPVILYPTTPEEQNEMTQQAWSPPVAGPARAATPADAAIHRTNMDVLTTVLKDRSEELTERAHTAGQGGGVSDAVARELGESGRVIAKHAIDEANARMGKLQEQVEDRDKEIRRLGAKIEELNEGRAKMAEELASAKTEKRVADEQRAETLKRATEDVKLERDRATAEITRMTDAHKAEVERIGKQNTADNLRQEQTWSTDLRRAGTNLEEQSKRAKDEIESLTRRMDEKMKDVKEAAEQRVKVLEAELTRTRTETEASLTRIRTEERSRGDDMVKQAEKRLETQLADRKEAHDRELRQAKENWEARSEGVKTGLEFQLTQAKERLDELRGEIEEARKEISEGKDPLEAYQKLKEQAEKLGFEEKGGPKTAGDRFATVAGMGFGKFLEEAPKWMPEVARIIKGPGAPAQGQPGAPALPPGPQQQQQRRRGGVVYADGGPQPQPAPQPRRAPAAPQPQPPQYAPPPQPQYGPPAQAQQTPPAPEQPAEQEQSAQPAPAGDDVTSRIGRIFSPEAMVGFRSEVERAIDMGIEPDDWAQMFVMQYTEPSRMLIDNVKAKELAEVVRMMPSGAESAILRPEGKKWVEKMFRAVEEEHKKAASAG